MKTLYSILMFAVLMGLAATSSIHRYRCTEDSIVADMNQALARTLATKQDAYITPDTQSGRFQNWRQGGAPHAYAAAADGDALPC